MAQAKYDYQTVGRRSTVFSEFGDDETGRVESSRVGGPRWALGEGRWT